MRRGLGFLGLLVTIVIVAVVGVIAYQAGWSDGFAQHLPAASDGTAAPAPYYPYYYGGPHFFGFGWIFGLLFFLFFIWLLFRIVGFAMWGRRWGYGGGWKRQGFSGGGIPPMFDERMREWHQRVHSGQSGSETPASPGSPPPPPPTTA
ncbi:MAG TPA: hypothetical protein VGV88_15020 [Candidatus Dormibacteraeota bacterium]|nr:hypothetical protein [Candidatus Dormibacteraeota bacterium]